MLLKSPWGTVGIRGLGLRSRRSEDGAEGSLEVWKQSKEKCNLGKKASSKLWQLSSYRCCFGEERMLYVCIFETEFSIQRTTTMCHILPSTWLPAYLGTLWHLKTNTQDHRNHFKLSMYVSSLLRSILSKPFFSYTVGKTFNCLFYNISNHLHW